ncbi:MAG TPA: protease inhibitor I42 family protein [Dehalococcoidia bacterium]|nr:protease inhibitor I42 family protein [Dehalococcoidia bacterium]
MKAFLLLALLTLAAAACGGSPASSVDDHLHLTAKDNGRTFDIAKGGEIMVVLSSNASSGFSWAVLEPLPDQLRLQGEPEYVPPRGASPAAGAPGEQVFTFRAAKSGTAELRLSYRRPFDSSAAPAETFAATIVVR